MFAILYGEGDDQLLVVRTMRDKQPVIEYSFWYQGEVIDVRHRYPTTSDRDTDFAAMTEESARAFVHRCKSAMAGTGH